MTVLVDTDALLFALLAPERLSPRARRVLKDRGSALVWSAASTWEVVVKARLGKLDLGGDVAAVLGEQLLRIGCPSSPLTTSSTAAPSSVSSIAEVGGSGTR